MLGSGTGAERAVDAFVAGDQEALAAVYDRWSPLIYTLALRTLKSVPAAERVTQQVFVRAWSSRETFDAAEVELATWLIGVAKEEMALSRPVAAATESVEEQPGEVDDNLAAQLLLAAELSHLDTVPREVLRMSLFDRLTQRQIADRLHLPVSVVGNHLQHSLSLLRDRAEVTNDAH